MISGHLTGFLLNHGRISKGALERSSSTYSRTIYPYRRNSNVIVTLDPRKFSEKKQQRLHIGDRQSFKPLIPLHNQSSPVVGPGLYYNYHMRGKVPYPPYTTAFLYYFTSSKKPRIAGELRLRLVSSDDHASFESGTDLLTFDGQPWSRSLYSVSKYHIPLYEKLREEGFVSDDLDAALSSLPRKTYRCQELYTLNDTFTFDFSSPILYLTVITEQGMERLRVVGPYDESRQIRMSPYTGSALARLERSTLPVHKDTRTVVLRILKIIKPVKCVIHRYDDYVVPPKEGELHRRYTKYKKDKSDPIVWSVDIDRPRGQRGFPLLWDA